MQVAIRFHETEPVGAGPLTVKCNCEERRVWVQRVSNGSKQIVFSSTFDTVISSPSQDARLYDSVIKSSVQVAAEGRDAFIVCLGAAHSDKENTLFGALARGDSSEELSMAKLAMQDLLRAGKAAGQQLTLSVAEVYFEVLTDLVQHKSPPSGSRSGPGGGSSGVGGLPAEAVADEMQGWAMLSDALLKRTCVQRDSAHILVKFSLNGGGSMTLIEVARLDALTALNGTRCHKSLRSLQRSLTKLPARPGAGDTALLPRLLRPALDLQASTQFLVCVSNEARGAAADALRLAQQVAKARIGRADKCSRQQAVVEQLQAKLAETRDSPDVSKIEEKLAAAVGGGAAPEQLLSSVASERVDLEARLAEAKRAGPQQIRQVDVDAEVAAWKAQEEALREQLQAEKHQAEKLLHALGAAGALHADAAETGEETGSSAPADSQATKNMQAQIDRYERAVESAWVDVQRAQRQTQETEERFDGARALARQSAAEREEMETTLLDVASDLESLARNYRQHGSPAMAVPLYVSALAIFEKTLGQEHPQVASNLVNLGNAFCDQQKHIEAVPVYLRALAIDERALGHDHPEVAMDLSNLGIAYRALGRADIATGLFERAHKLMLNAVGPDDPKTQAILRNLS